MSVMNDTSSNKTNKVDDDESSSARQDGQDLEEVMDEGLPTLTVRLLIDSSDDESANSHSSSDGSRHPTLVERTVIDSSDSEGETSNPKPQAVGGGAFPHLWNDGFQTSGRQRNNRKLITAISIRLSGGWTWTNQIDYYYDAPGDPK